MKLELSRLTIKAVPPASGSNPAPPHLSSGSAVSAISPRGVSGLTKMMKAVGRGDAFASDLSVKSGLVARWAMPVGESGAGGEDPGEIVLAEVHPELMQKCSATAR